MKIDTCTLEKKLETAQALLRDATARFVKRGLEVEEYRAVLDGVALLIRIINETEKVRSPTPHAQSASPKTGMRRV